MNAPSRDIKDMIVASGYGTYSVNLFVSYMPETPDSCISVFDILGRKPELNYEWEYPFVYVQVRGTKGGYEAAYTLLNNIATYLHGRKETINSAVYKLISQEGDIGHISNDDKNRPILGTRFQIQRTSE